LCKYKYVSRLPSVPVRVWFRTLLINRRSQALWSHRDFDKLFTCQNPTGAAPHAAAIRRRPSLYGRQPPPPAQPGPPAQAPEVAFCTASCESRSSSSQRLLLWQTFLEPIWLPVGGPISLQITWSRSDFAAGAAGAAGALVPVSPAWMAESENTATAKATTNNPERIDNPLFSLNMPRLHHSRDK
jgi:hypothetical protein